jgi:hypothetical protein
MTKDEELECLGKILEGQAEEIVRLSKVSYKYQELLNLLLNGLIEKI